MSLTRKLGRQVKESLRTVDIFINSLQNKDSDSTEEIKVKLLDLKEKLQEVSGYFDQVEADKSRAVKDGADLDYRSFMTEISQRRVVSPLRELSEYPTNSITMNYNTVDCVDSYTYIIYLRNYLPNTKTTLHTQLALMKKERNPSGIEDRVSP